MAKRTCLIEGCESPALTRGWCRAHYLRWYKTGDPLKIRPGRWDGYERPDCLVAGCDRLAHARGLCSVHFPRQRRHADPLAGRRPNATGTELERFWFHVDRGGPDECWPWLYGLYPTGYAQFTSGDGVNYGHRWSYQQFVGPIPDGLVIDHRCHNEDQICPGGNGCHHRRCVNPAHLEVVTNAQNNRRGRRRTNDC